MNPTRRQAIETFVIAGSALVSSRSLGAAPGDASPAPIKIGLYGTTHSHAGGKAAAIRKRPDLFDVVGVVEPDERRRLGLASRSDYKRLAVLSEEQMLSVPGL